MQFAHDGRQNMRVVQVEIVTGSIQVSRHQADSIETILALISLTHFDAGNFCDGISIIARLQGSRQQILFLQRLGGMFWVNA